MEAVDMEEEELMGVEAATEGTMTGLIFFVVVEVMLHLATWK